MDIRELMSEKESIQDKLNKLENIKNEIKEIVYSKVKNDYETKLDDINKAIKENESDVLVEIENTKNELIEVDKFVEQFENELEEINVRITLGDYTAEEYEEKQKELNDEVNTYKTRKDELNNKLEELESIIPPSENSENEAEIDSQKKDLPEEIVIPPMEIENEQEDITTGERDIRKETDISEKENAVEDEIIKEFGEKGIEDSETDNHKSPLSNILQPILGEEYGDTDEDDEPIKPELHEFFKNKNENESELAEDHIEGIVCPKCKHMNDANLMNCEKCGTELF